MIANNLEELLQRGIYLSYISLIFNAYFFYNLNLVDTKTNFTNWLMAFIVAFIANVGFIIKWSQERDRYYWTGILTHFISAVPLLIAFLIYIKKREFYKLPIIILLIAIIVYSIMQYYIY